MDNAWLPTDYKVPENSGEFMKLGQGENRFRVLDKAVLGYEYWVDIVDADGKAQRKPKRVKMDTQIDIGEVGDNGIKHFWAMPVYNLDTKSIQILVITQKGIQKAIKALVDNKKWGSPENYNLVISRVGEGLDTEYTITPEPRDEAEERMLKDIKASYDAIRVDLNDLYSSTKNPFGGYPIADAKKTTNESIIENTL